jgi:L-rhamnose isomerase
MVFHTRNENTNHYRREAVKMIEKGHYSKKYIINNISASIFAYKAITPFKWNNRNNIVDDVNISFNVRDFEFFK